MKLETLQRGKTYKVVKRWSSGIPGMITGVRGHLEVGELIRFRGPNWTGAEFFDKEGKLVILEKHVAFDILRNKDFIVKESDCHKCGAHYLSPNSKRCSNCHSARKEL